MVATELDEIAVVDDDDSVRRAVGRVLTGAGFRVALYRSGEELLTSIGRPACVVLDIHLPGLSGLDVEARLRAIDPSIPIVFCTGSASAEVHAVAERSGRTCLHKPVHHVALVEAVVRAIQRSRPGSV